MNRDVHLHRKSSRYHGHSLRRVCWHSWVCRHGVAASECSSGPDHCARCGLRWEER